MQTDRQDLPALVKEVRKQLTLSQEGLARELGVSFATVNRWENNHVTPSKLARAQFDAARARVSALSAMIDKKALADGGAGVNIDIGQKPPEPGDTG